MKFRTQIKLWVMLAVIFFWVGGILTMIYGSEAMRIPQILIIGTYFIGAGSWFILEHLPNWMLHGLEEQQKRFEQVYGKLPAESVVNKEDSH